MIKTLHQSPRDPAFVQDPYPFYTRARAAGPLFTWAEYGHLCAARYADVSALLRDRRFGRELPEDLKPAIPEHLRPFYEFESHSMLEREPPAHTRLRGLVVRAFTTRRIAAMEAQITRLCHELIDRFPASGPFDLLPAYAEPIPVIVIARILDIPEDMAPQLLRWSHDMVAMYQASRDRATEDRAVTATLEFADYMRSVLALRRKAPGDDLLSELIAARDAGDRLSEDELISTAVLLLNAGHEATVHSIANGVRAVLVAGQDCTSMIANETSILAMVEETLRIDPPLHMFTRFALCDMQVLGHDFRRGQVVGLLLAAANHDPLKFPRPGQFDIVRGGVGNVSFGAGLHFCVGAPLARLEIALALSILFARCPGLRLKAAPRYADRYHFHGLEQLMVLAG